MAVWATSALVALVGIAALTIDVGCLYVAKQQLQNVADAAALAAAGALVRGAGEQAARQEATDLASANRTLGQPVIVDPSSDVVFGSYDRTTGDFTPGCPSNDLPAVKVQARRTCQSPSGPVPMAFSSIFGIHQANVSASAVADLTHSHRLRKPVHFVVLQDGSLSFADEFAYAQDADKALVNLVSDVTVSGDLIGVAVFCGSAWCEADMSALPGGGGYLADAIDTADHCVSSQQMQTDPDRYYGTHTGAGIQKAASMLGAPDTSDTRRVIVLVSDGMPYPEDRRPMAISAADVAASYGIVIHTVTLVQEEGGTYGVEGADAEFNAGLVRNGGYAFCTDDPGELEHLLISVATMEVGHPHLIH